MRRSILSTALALVLALALATAAQAQPKGLTKIAENVYSYVGVKDASPKHSYAANAGIVIGTDGVLVIDTLATAKEGKRLLKDIRAVTKKPIKYVVTTHEHFDHALGSSVFTDLGATLVAHELNRAYLAKNGESMLKKIQAFGLSPQDIAGTRIVLPSLTFTERLTIRLGSQDNEVVELIHLTSSHSPGSTLVYLPRQKVLFAGDVLFTDFHPFMGEGDVPGWVKTLDFIDGLDATAIIPGHGPLSTKKDVADMREYIQLFDAKAKELAPTAKDPASLAAEMKKLLPARSLGEGMIQYNLMIKYLPAKK
ncbi:MAG: MBL fold metallo-hydrolase [Proteobacteria bacterium]|nr:MBL fold metallo-hydrolase [Pseudomonadota bacterium]MBU1596431.1 MBL fold metallo-hydrolase [Pseudomonadota bacterium]